MGYLPKGPGQGRGADRCRMRPMQACAELRSWPEKARIRPSARWYPQSQLSEWAYSGWLECGDSSCKAHVPIFARLNPAVSPGARQRESMDWIWDGVHCPSGHAIPKPVLRLEPPCSLDCPSCGATSWEEPRDWFQDEKRIECVFCGKFLTLTAEHISSLRCGHA